MPTFCHYAIFYTNFYYAVLQLLFRALGARTRLAKSLGAFLVVCMQSRHSVGSARLGRGDLDKESTICLTVSPSLRNMSSIRHLSREDLQQGKPWVPATAICSLQVSRVMNLQGCALKHNQPCFCLGRSGQIPARYIVLLQVL